MNFFIAMIVPTIITIVIFSGLIENKKVYDIFCDGAKDGIKVTLKMFPTLIGIFLAINILNSSGFLNFIVGKIVKITSTINIPAEIVPLSIIRSISGSASIAMGTDLMSKYGVDSKIGMMAGAIMGSSETTLYVTSIYLSQIKCKKSKKILIPALIADFASVATAILLLK